MDQIPPVGYPHQQQQRALQQAMNGGSIRSGQRPTSDGPMNNLPPHGPPAMTSPGMDIPIGPQIPGNTMDPGVGGLQAQNMMGHHRRVDDITMALTMTNLSGAGVGAPATREPPSNQGPGSGQMPFVMGRRGSQGSTAPSTPSVTSSSVTPPSPSAMVNGRSTINTVVADMTQPLPFEPTSGLPDVPDNFLTAEFMESVARTPDDFDMQTRFRYDGAGINFEEFREWFDPDDLFRDEVRE